MLELYVFIIFLSLSLAIVSRKHFSKYKDKGRLALVFYSIGDMLYNYSYKYLPTNKVKEQIRSTRVLNHERLNQAVEQYFVRLFALSYGFFLAFTSLSAAAYIGFRGGEVSNVVVREAYGGDEKEQEVILEKEDDRRTFHLAISPRIYTKEEFLKKADAVFSSLPEEMVGRNIDLSHIEYDLNLVESDKDGIFQIEWMSSSPSYITPTGVVSEGVENKKVTLVAEIFYMGYTARHEYEVTVDSLVKEKEGCFDEALAVLKGIETDSRQSDSVTFPDSVGDVKVVLPNEENKTYLTVFCFGIAIVFLLAVKSFNDLKSSKYVRDNLLINQYSELVNHLWLFIGAGMTIKNALAAFLKTRDMEQVLTKEIALTINLIEAGENEALAYEELGKRLQIKEYIRLFSHISQNLRMGTKDIRSIMEDELMQAEAIRRELLKKRGEEASTKLTFPMIIMLVVVMIIVMVPALVGYN